MNFVFSTVAAIGEQLRRRPKATNGATTTTDEASVTSAVVNADCDLRTTSAAADGSAASYTGSSCIASVSSSVAADFGVSVNTDTSAAASSVTWSSTGYNATMGNVWTSNQMNPAVSGWSHIEEHDSRGDVATASSTRYFSFVQPTPYTAAQNPILVVGLNNATRGSALEPVASGQHHSTALSNNFTRNITTCSGFTIQTSRPSYSAAFQSGGQYPNSIQAGTNVNRYADGAENNIYLHRASSAPSYITPQGMPLTAPNNNLQQMPRSVNSVIQQPICASFEQQNVTSSQNHFYTYSAPHINSNFPFIQRSAEDITLSSSQVAARQVITKDLPNFSGKPEDWPLFITNFDQSTERCGFTDQENLIRLQKCLRGPALEAVRGKLMMPSTVPLAIETLRMLYGRPDVIHQVLQRKLRQEPAVKTEKLETLISFALAVQNYKATIQAIGLADYLNDPMLLNDLLGKLPSDLKLNWGRHKMSLGRVDIGVFDEWLFGLATCASQVTPLGPCTTFEYEEKRDALKQTKHRVMVHEVIDHANASTRLSNNCPNCFDCHRLADCSSFITMGKQDRWRFIKEKKLCLRCFKQHNVRRCSSKKQCGVDGCKMAHNALLHGDGNHADPNHNSSSSSTSTQASTILFHAKDHKVTIFRYVPVTLFGRSKWLNTYALIDEGAACTLIESDIACQLGLDGPSEELCLRWTGDITQNEVNSKLVELNIASSDPGSQKYSLRNVRTVTSLDLPTQSIDTDMLNHLKKVPIRPYCKAKATIIIGLDNAKIGVPLEIYESSGEDLIAARCKIGWSVYGRHSIGSSDIPRVMHICPCSDTDGMNEIMKKYFALDAIGVSLTANPLQSKDNERAQKIMEATTRYIKTEKKWESGLLWKFDRVDLPDSLPMARRRLQCLESKMARDTKLKTFLREKVKDYEQKGYIRKLSNSEIISGGKSWYLPIFTVTNKNKNKTRIVWDAAATVNNIALNSVLLTGPDLLKSLPGILIRFRENPVAICGDIREMFHQIQVMKEDQVAQKFLWRDGDTSRYPDTYVMGVMTFGATCSPSLANYVKNKNANRFIQEHPEAVSAIINNTFVDDWLQSSKTNKEMIQLATTVRRIHEDGGFEMRSWLSNSKSVLQALTGQNEQLDKCIEDSDSNYEKVLGMWWMTKSDELTFVEKFSKEVFDETTFPTKRQILRIIMTIYDPLGILGFFVIYAKVIMQDVWRSGVGWDESIHPEQREDWWKWIRFLPEISKIRVPRCYPLISCSQNTQLHIFVDASINAYAAVAYLRAEQDGMVRCCLVASKSRVAPLKPISIPRLELMGAILGLRLAHFIGTELSVRVDRRTFWTDSKNVLYWIRSDARKFHQFVALRIGEILEGSQVKEWRWVPTADNVADEGTKWSKCPEFNSNSRWFVGPTFLSKPENQWPCTELARSNEEESEIVFHIQLQKETVSAFAVILPDPKRFSRWEKLVQAQKYVLKFLYLISRNQSLSTRTEHLVNIKNIDEVEYILFRNCQEEAFGNELRCLKSESGTVSRGSTIYKCSPYIDDSGLLRVKGRIDAVDGVELNVKRPIILPRSHIVTQLVTNFYHRKFLHHHNEIVVNEMRQKFCIHGLRELVSATAKSCQLCRNRRAQPFPPQMRDLPSERLATFTKAFTYTGVDYFGPLDIVVGRHHEKRWGVLFTCLTIRAVHIEITPSLSTDSFLLVLKQFVSRRGVPRRIVSDNATNFRGASRILLDEIEKVSSEELEQKHPEIEWRFNPPASPHMGGAWERMVRSVKSILMEILPEHGMREEVLRAVLADVENILNSRPLTYVPLHSPESEALTPNHFLIGTSNGLRERGSEDDSGLMLGKNFRISSLVADQFWRRWVREYLPCLTRRTKWFQKPVHPISLNDVVVIVDEKSKRNTWQKGIIVDVCLGQDGQARSAVVKTVNGLVTRPVVKLAKLDVIGKQP